MIRRVFIAAVLTALVASLAYAQRGGGGGGGDMGGGGRMGGGVGRGPRADKLEQFTAELKLSPEQQTAIAAIMDESQKQADPLLQQIADQKKQMLEVAAEGKDLSDLTKQLGALNAQILDAEASAFTKTLAKLDAKQKAKAPKLFEEMNHMFSAPGGWHKST
jgi:Spy/CpxP family protein refolding chaperone